MSDLQSAGLLLIVGSIAALILWNNPARRAMAAGALRG
jgi:hypothetical protein